MGNEKFLAAIQQAVSEVPFFYDLDCPGNRECDKQGCTHHWAKTLEPMFERFIQNLEGAEQWRVICPKCGVIQRYPTEPTAPFVCEMCEYSEVKVGGTE